MDVIIRNGLIYDGSGGVPCRADVCINKGIIEKIGTAPAVEGVLEIRADQLVVTPGFIDVHRHCDYAAIGDEEFGRIELTQGITSICGGNCGLGISPSTETHRSPQYDYVEPCIGKVPWERSYEQFGQYLSSLGISMGLMYQPECYSTAAEMQDLLRAASPYGRPLVCHIRGEGDSLVSSVREVIDLAKRAELPLQISHFKATGIRNWNGTIERAIEAIEEARDKGLSVTVDFYPYCSGATTLISLLPLCVMEESVEETLHQLTTVRGRARLKTAMNRTYKGWDNMVKAIGWNNIIISGLRLAEHQSLSGRTMTECARLMGCEDPCDAMCELLVREEGKVGIRLASMAMQDVERVAALPYSVLISDSLYGSSGSPHPRLYGAFPKFLREFVRERKVLPMETAVAKMTLMPAERFGIIKRGAVREGYYADLNLFDPELFTDHATYEQPRQLSTGLSYTLIGGEIVCHNDRLICRTPQSVLRAH